jgi:transcriptional regulator
MAPDKSDLLQGTLDLLILKTLDDEPLHGYAIAQRIQQSSRALLHVPQGSLYPALHRLENRGWLAASWATSETGRDTKVYKLTRRGRKELEREIANWRRLADAIGFVLQTGATS